MLVARNRRALIFLELPCPAPSHDHPNFAGYARWFFGDPSALLGVPGVSGFFECLGSSGSGRLGSSLFAGSYEPTISAVRPCFATVFVLNVLSGYQIVSFTFVSAIFTRGSIAAVLKITSQGLPRRKVTTKAKTIDC